MDEQEKTVELNLTADETSEGKRGANPKNVGVGGVPGTMIPSSILAGMRRVFKGQDKKKHPGDQALVKLMGENPAKFMLILATLERQWQGLRGARERKKKSKEPEDRSWMEE